MIKKVEWSMTISDIVMEDWLDMWHVLTGMTPEEYQEWVNASLREAIDE